MSQNKQNRDRQPRREDSVDPKNDQLREGRSDGPMDRAKSTPRPDQVPDLEDVDEMDDEDRDDDLRAEGGPNRRRGIN